MGDSETRRIEVSFGVDIDLKTLREEQKALENLRPATVEYTRAFDRLKSMKAYILARLEGECLAYMNIAKAELKELYGL